MRLLSFHLRGERAILADLSSARNACSRAPWIRKLGYLCIQEILVLTKSFVRTSVRLSLHVSGCEMSHALDWSPRHILRLTWFGLPCFGQLTALKKGYPLTSVT